MTGPLTGVLGTSAESAARIGLIRSILFGVIMERCLFAHEPARSVPTAELEPLLTEVLAMAFGAPRAPAPAAPRSAPPLSPPSQPGPAADADTRVFALRTECAARYRTLIGRVVKRHGISLAAFEALAELRRAEVPYRRTMSELATAGAVRAGGVTHHADRLERAGLIERERDERDRRLVRLRLTPAGLGLVDRVGDERRAGERQLLDSLRPDGRRRLTALLDTLGHALADDARPHDAAPPQDEARAQAEHHRRPSTTAGRAPPQAEHHRRPSTTA
ncbi:MarR family winged helix-turn-helix transcriptional regulator [Streptomyces sp. NPDC018610]|uniref:MarR family winged helix-turn-helix transcriptional regulator n=1 Tax=Streptomyces sp. NPDC018610 TaxID=3365049 RepID=UPI0037AD1D61